MQWHPFADSHMIYSYNIHYDVHSYHTLIYSDNPVNPTFNFRHWIILVHDFISQLWCALSQEGWNPCKKSSLTYFHYIVVEKISLYFILLVSLCWDLTLSTLQPAVENPYHFFQIVQTQIRGLLQEPSDQGLDYLKMYMEFFIILNKIGKKSPRSNFGMVQRAVLELSIILSRGERVNFSLILFQSYLGGTRMRQVIVPPQWNATATDT